VISQWSTPILENILKVLITFEDQPTEEDENNVSISFDFDPPMEEITEMTAAGFLATEVMRIISERIEELDDADESSIILASS